MVALLMGLFLSFFLWSPSWAQGLESCQALANRVLPSSPSYKLSFKARLQSSESLEAQDNFYTGIHFELPLVDPSAQKRLRQRRQEKEALLITIARYQNARRLLAFKRELLQYHRLRIQEALEDNQAFLQVKEEVLLLEGRIKELKAKLLAYGIGPEEAARCHW